MSTEVPIEATIRGARAVRPEEKAARRAAILDEARAMLDEGGWEAVSMAALARRCGVAKGTLYLYFRTKEAVFLALLDGEIEAFFAGLNARLDAAGELAPDDLAGEICAAVLARPRLAPLMALLHAVLEHNVSRTEAHAFKHRLLAAVQTTGAALERCAPWLGDGGGARLVLELDTVVIGLEQMARPAPVVAELIEEDPDLAVFDVDFGQTLAVMLRTLCRGHAART